MAVKRARRSMPRISCQKFFSNNVVENVKNCRRSGRLSGLDLSKFSPPKVSPKNRNLSLYEKDLCSITTERKQVASSNLQSSYENSKSKQMKTKNIEKVALFKKISKSKQRQEHVHSSTSPKTSIYRTKSPMDYKVPKKPAKFTKASSLPFSKTSILTRSQRNSLKLNKSKNAFLEISSMIEVKDLPQDSSRKKRSFDHYISEQTFLGSLETPRLTRCRSVDFIIDCLNLNHSSRRVEAEEVSKKIVNHKSSRNTNMQSQMRKGKHRVRSQSEKISNPLKPATEGRKRIKSLPIDDLVCSTSKNALKKNCKEVVDRKPVSKCTSVELKAKKVSKVPKVSEKKSLKAEKTKISPKEPILSKIQKSSTDSKLNMKRKRNSNDCSEIINSNSVIKRTRSSLSTVINMDSDTSLCSENIDEKSKRHTLPMRSAKGGICVSSQNHQKTRAEAYDKQLNSTETRNLNTINHKNIPLDDLTIFNNSFKPCTVRLSKTIFVSSTPIKHTTKKRPVQDKNGASSKSKKAVKSGKAKLGSNSRKKSCLGLPNSIPKKGTLKRKRWILNTLKERNDGYEDDLFESRKFDEMKAALEISDDETDTDCSISTPKCGFILTPSLPKKTPMFKDCISSLELLEARKNAEEYQFRRNKKWKNNEIKNDQEKHNSMSMDGTSENEIDLPEKKKLDYSLVLEKIVEAQRNIEKLTQDESEEEDAYFSEASD